MDQASLFAEHINYVQNIYERALTDLGAEKDAPDIDGVLLHSGSISVYFGDDRHVQFEAFGHFLHWLPLNRPGQMVLFVPGKKPTWFQVVPSDFWYEQTMELPTYWADSFDIVQLCNAREVMDHLSVSPRLAFLGENTLFAADMGLPAYLHNERHLSNYLDFYRGMKSPYEVAQIREANRLAMIGHKAARFAFEKGGSEWRIHLAFLNANNMIEHESPYTNIVALDEKAAILHYQNKRHRDGRNAQVMLIDAGCRVQGYASDITRTYARDSAHPVFQKLLAGMDELQLKLVDMARPGVPYIKIHEATHDGVLDLLLANGIVEGERETLVTQKLSNLFFPHGVGHLLGIQVHDVGGFFKDDHGKLAPPPAEHQFLRLNREMAPNMVFTIEPGLYFIPVLLEPERQSERGKHLNWELIDALIPLGGIRIEDNILVTDGAPVNLTRN